MRPQYAVTAPAIIVTTTEHRRSGATNVHAQGRRVSVTQQQRIWRLADRGGRDQCRHNQRREYAQLLPGDASIVPVVPRAKHLGGCLIQRRVGTAG